MAFKCLRISRCVYPVYPKYLICKKYIMQCKSCIICLYKSFYCCTHINVLAVERSSYFQIKEIGCFEPSLRSQFYIQLVYKPYFAFYCMFGPLEQLRALIIKNWVFHSYFWGWVFQLFVGKFFFWNIVVFALKSWLKGEKVFFFSRNLINSF